MSMLTPAWFNARHKSKIGPATALCITVPLKCTWFHFSGSLLISFVKIRFGGTNGEFGDFLKVIS